MTSPHKLLLFYVSLISFVSTMKSYGQPGIHGVVTISGVNAIINEFTTLTANASAGSSSINVANANLNSFARFPGNLAAGDLIMIIQMQGASLVSSDTNSANWGAVASYNNAGNYEFCEVAGVPNSTSIVLSAPLSRSYTASGKVQVVRVPRYTQMTLNAGASVSTDNWDGTKGGVIAIEVNSNLTNNGLITASGKGFRGGIIDSLSNNPPDTIYASRLPGKGAEKGEGIGGSVLDYDLIGGRYGRGAPANGGGGGNSHNCGGGGGANGDNGVIWNGRGIPDTVSGLPTYRWRLAWDLESPNFSANRSSGGGRGGYSWSRDNENALLIGCGNPAWRGSNRQNVGGLGGRPLLSVPNQKMFMGGGGGAGDGNDRANSNGANGGGIICLIISGNLSGSGTIETNGANAAPSSGKDAPGGGGGGGTVYMNVRGNISGNINLSARGGNGGNQANMSTVNEAEGPGGGGGGGALFLSQIAAMNINISGGRYGTTDSQALLEFLPNGATSGASGYLFTGIGLPVELLSFDAMSDQNSVLLKWTTATEINNDYFLIYKSHDGLNYSPLTRVQGTGNSTVNVNYEAIDDSPFEGNNYYILEQTDFDGSSRTHGPVTVYYRKNLTNEGFISAGPIPFSNYLDVTFSSLTDKNITLVLIDQLGKVALTRNIPANKGFNTFRLEEVDLLSKGMYYLQLKVDSEKYSSIRLIK